MRTNTTSDPALSNYKPTPEEAIQSIKNMLITNFNTPADFMERRSRTQEYVHARYICFYLIIKKGNLISILGLDRITGWDHSTIIFGMNRVLHYIEMRKKTSCKRINKHFEKYESLICE